MEIRECFFCLLGHVAPASFTDRILMFRKNNITSEGETASLEGCGVRKRPKSDTAPDRFERFGSIYVILKFLDNL